MWNLLLLSSKKEQNSEQYPQVPRQISAEYLGQSPKEITLVPGAWFCVICPEDFRWGFSQVNENSQLSIFDNAINIENSQHNLQLSCKTQQFSSKLYIGLSQI